MHHVDLHFRSFDEISFADIIGSTGVYVLWTARARRQPSYIGEGWVMSRVASHVDRFGAALDGYFAPVRGSAKQAKRDQEIAEAVLLLVGELTDRAPRFNRNAGRGERVAELAGRHGVLRITVAGRDPFAPPGSPRLTRRRTIRIDLNALARPDSCVEDCARFPWRRLPRR